MNERHFGLPPCACCSKAKPNLCERIAYYGLSEGGGGLASEIVVKWFSCIPLPDNVPLDVGALTEPLAVAWHAIRTSGFQKGQTALILGAGPIGLAILMLLQVWGASGIVVSEVTESRSEQARKYGATTVVNPLQSVKQTGSEAGSDVVLDAVKALDPEGVDVSYDATGMQSTLDTAVAAAKPCGVIFNVAIHEKPLLINLNDISCSEKRLLGGICYTKEDFDGVVKALASESIPAKDMITSRVPLSKVVDGGFMELINNKANHIKILIHPD